MATEIAQAAAKWWADLLRSQTPPIHDAGMDDPDAMALTIKMTMVSSLEYKPIPPEKIDVFEMWLTVAIKQWMAEKKYVVFGTDYEPDKPFAEVITDCGLSLTFRLPIKTMMFINNGQVKVRRGYGAPIEVVYPLDSKD